MTDFSCSFRFYLNISPPQNVSTGLGTCLVSRLRLLTQQAPQILVQTGYYSITDYINSSLTSPTCSFLLSESLNKVMALCYLVVVVIVDVVLVFVNTVYKIPFLD